MIGSLFSWIGGLDLACESVFGLGVAWQCERDPFCRRVLAKHWPGVPCFDDVCNIGADAPSIEVLCGGFPCQDVSVAGARAGLEGERSGLWGEYLRLIRLLRPRVVVVENVTGRSGDGGASLTLAHAQGERRQARGLPFRASTSQPVASIGGNARDGHWAVEPSVGRVAHGVPERVARLRALGNAVVHQQASVAIRRLYEEVSHG